MDEKDFCLKKKKDYYHNPDGNNFQEENWLKEISQREYT